MPLKELSQSTLLSLLVLNTNMFVQGGSLKAFRGAIKNSIKPLGIILLKCLLKVSWSPSNISSRWIKPNAFSMPLSATPWDPVPATSMTSVLTVLPLSLLEQVGCKGFSFLHSPFLQPRCVMASSLISFKSQMLPQKGLLWSAYLYYSITPTLLYYIFLDGT